MAYTPLAGGGNMLQRSVPRTVLEHRDVPPRGDALCLSIVDSGLAQVGSAVLDHVRRDKLRGRTNADRGYLLLRQDLRREGHKQLDCRQIGIPFVVIFSRQRDRDLLHLLEEDLPRWRHEDKGRHWTKGVSQTEANDCPAYAIRHSFL